MRGLVLIAWSASDQGMPVVAAVMWGVFGAPGSARQLHGLWRAGLEFLILAGAAAGLFAAGQHVLALTFAGLVVVNEILLYSLGQAGGRPGRGN